MNRGFPELKTFMSVDDSGDVLARLDGRYIDDNQTVGVDVDCFVTNDQFLVHQIFVPQHIQVSIGNIKSVFVLHNELVLGRVILVKPDYEEAELAFEFVGCQVEYLVLMIVDDFFDARHIVHGVQIGVFFGQEIVVNAVLMGGHDHG